MRPRISEFCASCFVTTKHLLWVPALLVLTFATCVHADPVPTFNITIVVINVLPDFAGSTDSMFVGLSGPGAGLGWVGSNCLDWCDPFQSSLDGIGQPGQTIVLGGGSA